MAVRNEALFKSMHYPYVELEVTIPESDLGPVNLSCIADTGAEDYDIVLFDKDFDEARIHQSPMGQYIPLAGSAHSLSGNQYSCTVRFGRSGPSELTLIIVRGHVKRREAIVGRGFLDRFISLFDGPRQSLEILGA